MLRPVLCENDYELSVRKNSDEETVAYLKFGRGEKTTKGPIQGFLVPIKIRDRCLRKTRINFSDR